MKILIAGDFVPMQRTAEKIEQGDYSCLDEIKPIVQSADYSIVNFESPVVMHESKPIAKTGPNLRCTERAIECVAKAGFKCVTLANNHFRDYGQEGVEDTIYSCDKYDIEYVGGGRTLEEACHILYKDIDERRLAIINVCEHEWSIATDEYGGSNPLDIISVSRKIKEAKSKADYILLIVHGGTEQYNLPTPRMKDTYRFFVEQGADAVVNHHQHCYSGYEVFQGKPVFYGIGNLCFDRAELGRDAMWEHGFLVEIDFSEHITFRLYPYSQCTEDEPTVKLQLSTYEFDENIKRMNAIIEDDRILLSSFQKLSQRGQLTSKEILSPYSSKIAHKLYVKGLLPSFVTDRRLRLFLAHTQCESHRDILINGLKVRLEK